MEAISGTLRTTGWKKIETGKSEIPQETSVAWYQRIENNLGQRAATMEWYLGMIT
jgi:hypothetical protein